MTASELVTRALQKLGAIGLGDAASAEELDIGLKNLFTMLDGWALKRVNVPYSTRESLTLTAGTNPHTIGSGGVLDTGRPVEVLSAYITSEGTDYPLDVLMTEEYYNRLSDKTSQGLPEKLWYDKQYPLGKIWFNCPPDSAYTLVLSSTKVLNSVDLSANPETDLSFGPGYERAMIYNLAVEMSDDLRKTPNQTTLAIADASFKAIKAANTKIEPHRFSGMFTSWRR